MQSIEKFWYIGSSKLMHQVKLSGKGLTSKQAKPGAKHVKDEIERNFESYSSEGFRTIALAYKDVSDDPVITKDDETGMTFLGFILLSYP